MKDCSGIRVLVVDDEQFILDSLTGFLEDFDFTVSSAESAESALELLEENEFEAAVIDLRLPGMSGDLLIQKIHQKNPDMCFVIHTGSVGYTLSDELKAIGMESEHVFFKPLPDLTQLVESITSLVESRRQSNR